MPSDEDIQQILRELQEIKQLVKQDLDLDRKDLDLDKDEFALEQDIEQEEKLIEEEERKIAENTKNFAANLSGLRYVSLDVWRRMVWEACDAKRSKVTEKDILYDCALYGGPCRFEVCPKNISKKA